MIIFFSKKIFFFKYFFFLHSDVASSASLSLHYFGSLTKNNIKDRVLQLNVFRCATQNKLSQVFATDKSVFSLTFTIGMFVLALVDFIATLFSFPFSSLLSDCTDPSTLVLGVGLVRYKKDKQPAEMCLQIWLVSLISKMFFFYLYINNNKKYKYYLILFRHWKLFSFFCTLL